MIRRFHDLVALWVAGDLVLALRGLGMLSDRLNVAATGFVFLIDVVLQSLFDSFVHRDFSRSLPSGARGFTAQRLRRFVCYRVGPASRRAAIPRICRSGA